MYIAVELKSDRTNLFLSLKIEKEKKKKEEKKQVCDGYYYFFLLADEFCSVQSLDR